MKKRGIVAVIVLLLIALDQWVKAYVVQQIPLGEVRSWIPNLVSLTYLQNRGAAFSMLQDQQWLFAVITLVVMASAIWYLHKHMEDSVWLVFGLTLSIKFPRPPAIIKVKPKTIQSESSMCLFR